MSWEIGRVYTAKTGKGNFAGTGASDIGFHVFTTRKAAREMASYWNDMYPTQKHIVVKVEVSDFVAAGTFRDHSTETWKKCNIVEIAR